MRSVSDDSRVSISYRSYIAGRWGQIHLRRVSGQTDARPLLMLHQTPKSGWIWEPLFAWLGVTRSLIAPDTPGYGASDAPPLQASIEDFANEMIAMMDRLIPDGQFDVIGYHTGSVIAAAMGVIAPKRVRRIIFVSLPFYSADERAAKLAGLPDAPRLTDDGSHLGAIWRAIDGFTDARASLEWKQSSLTETLRAGSAMYWGYAAVYRFDLDSALARLRQDILILNPGDDLWEQTGQAARLLPRAKLIEMPNVAHGLFELEADRIAGAISDFLDR